ncbi:MAG TPA: IPT/TIG domain-containing protein, partial [Rudaea sp.]|uniref:IPT/TIG domain-containing protein n=1 Tax=Rudaea sp. TaxID=2136325 RepID=UPI002F95E1C4
MAVLSLLLLFVGNAVAQAPADTIVNWAASANGGVATVSSTASSKNYPASSLNDGDRTGITWGKGGGWQGKATSGDWAQIAFAATQTIETVSVYSLQDNYTHGIDPPESLTFTNLGLTAFDVQVFNGTNWVTVASIVGNNLVKRTVSFAPVATSAIRVVCNVGGTKGTAIVEIEAWGATGINDVALASNNGVAVSASSSSGDNFPASALNDGVTSGADWGLASDGGWEDATVGVFPDWAKIDFMNAQVVHAVTVWTLQDSATSPPPGDSTTFSKWGLTAFDIQAWNGTGWTTVASVTGNNLVKRTVTFAPVSTIMLRVVCNASMDGYSRLVEVQAWGIAAPLPPMLTSLSATSGAVGTALTIAGANFSVLPSANHVTFNGVAAVVQQAISTSLQVIVPTNATVGPIAVTVNGLTTTSVVNFTPGNQFSPAEVGPTITSFSPASGPPGTTVTITGTGFSTTPANNTVKFYQTAAIVTSASTTS